MSHVTREAFLYLEPRSGHNKNDFAQCASCRVWVGDVPKRGPRCVFHGSDLSIDEAQSCGFYTPWPTKDGKPVPEVVAQHAAELAKGLPASVTPEESGLVGKVQCRRCGFEENGATVCGLYRYLNRTNSLMFALDDNIRPHACCNAWGDKLDKALSRLYEVVKGST